MSKIYSAAVFHSIVLQIKVMIYKVSKVTFNNVS